MDFPRPLEEPLTGGRELGRCEMEGLEDLPVDLRGLRGREPDGRVLDEKKERPLD